MKADSLYHYWHTICGTSITAQQALTRLQRQYQQPWRRYHTLNHIEQMLLLFNQYESHISSPPTVFLAICYHDYIYLPWWKNNEKRSAIKASQALEKLQLTSISPTVEQMIMATEKHLPLSIGIDANNADTYFLLDCDLAVLGSHWENYQDYSKKIRKEYWFVPRKKYQTGRRHILTNFLKREKLYYSETFFNQYEQQARDNIQREINLLS